MNYINYCINLTEEEKFEIAKQVRKNRFALRFAMFFPFFTFPIVPYVPYMRAGNKARLFFKYSDKENGAVEILAKSKRLKGCN